MAATLRAHLAPQGIDWDKLQAATEDKLHVSPAYRGPACANPSLGIWGIHVRSADYGEGHYEEFTDFPLAGKTTPQEVDAYPWPNPDWFDYASVAAAIPANRTRATQFGVHVISRGGAEAQRQYPNSPQRPRASARDKSGKL